MSWLGNGWGGSGDGSRFLGEFHPSFSPSPFSDPLGECGDGGFCYDFGHCSPPNVGGGGAGVGFLNMGVFHPGFSTSAVFSADHAGNSGTIWAPFWLPRHVPKRVPGGRTPGHAFGAPPNHLDFYIGAQNGGSGANMEPNWPQLGPIEPMSRSPGRWVRRTHRPGDPNWPHLGPMESKWWPNVAQSAPILEQSGDRVQNKHSFWAHFGHIFSRMEPNGLAYR